jgi:hypothetical protein
MHLWLDASVADPAKVAGLMKPFDSCLMRVPYDLLWVNPVFLFINPISVRNAVIRMASCIYGVEHIEASEVQCGSGGHHTTFH